MATHTMKINPLSFNMIEEGKKTLEVRLRRDGVEQYATGDTIEIQNRESGQTLKKTIARVTQYATLNELMQQEDLGKTGAFQDTDAFRTRMRSFQTEDEEREFGLTAIHLG